jgi:hypothetical protein
MSPSIEIQDHQASVQSFDPYVDMKEAQNIAAMLKADVMAQLVGNAEVSPINIAHVEPDSSQISQRTNLVHPSPFIK